jgi:Lipase (class 3)
MSLFVELMKLLFLFALPSFVTAFLASYPARFYNSLLRSTEQRLVEQTRVERRELTSSSLWATNNRIDFDVSTAVLCGGLAFDVYVEPAANSSRWERGSGGLAVAYSSRAFARKLYKGILEIKVDKITGLPETESNQAERLISGDGVDACLLVAVVEGQWKEDVEILEKEQFHEGVLDLTGAAHVSRSTTCWSTVKKPQSDAAERINGKPTPYFVPKTWNRSPQAVWPPNSQRSFYLYVQDPATARIVLTVMDDERLGSGLAVGSTFKRLTDLIPEAGYDPTQFMNSMKDQIVTKLSRGGKVDPDVIDSFLSNPENLAPKWNGELPLTSKPRKRNKNSQIMAGAAAGAYLAGPVGAAAGAIIANFYEGQIQGRIHLEMSFLPTALSALPEREVYQVKGGLPGTDWGSLYNKHREKSGLSKESAIQDLEHCFFISHEKTGATCSVYRSIMHKTLIVSFRGTCAPIDLLTDASLVQDAWVEGEEVANQSIVKVHRGFRSSLNSISRRLKELLLAAPEGNIAEYDMLVTGHSVSTS